MKTVYLAGAINGMTIDQANDWRLVATKKLEAAGFRVLNPLRGRTGNEPAVEIVERDLKDIDESDFLLVEMNQHNRAYIGTSMEIRYAYERKKIIILWGNANPASFWLNYHVTMRYPNLELALEAIIYNR